MATLISLLPLSSFGSTEPFLYNPQVGKCLNAQGIEGLNTPDLSAIFSFDPGKDLNSDDPTISDKNLECADLKGVSFREFLGSGFKYVSLINWNLNGAAFSKTNITWMTLIGGSLDGVDLSGAVGYTIFQSVHIDSNTRGLSENCVPDATGTVNCQM